MQKDMVKILDDELNKNGLVRILDPYMKSQNSIFRAISMCLYYNHTQWDKIHSYMRLCGLASCQLTAAQNPFPPVPPRSKYLIKFQDWKATGKDYFNNPDLQCFHKENLEMASLLFDAQVELYSLSGPNDQCYLQTTIINIGKASASFFLRDKVPIKKIIRMAKINNRYYAILTLEKNKIISFIKEFISYSLTNLNNPSTNLNQPNKIQHYPYYQETHPHNRQHKKSLSDYGDLTVFNDAQFDENEPNYNPNKHMIENQIKNTQQDQIISHPLDATPEQTFMDNNNIHNKQINSVDEALLNSNLLPLYPIHYMQYSPYDYNHQYPSLSHSQSHSEPLEQQPSYTLNNNCEYQGRLKFFDQNKNYGFIVVDEINEDLFVHLDDLSKAGISKEALKNNVEMRFLFTCLEYDGKYKKSKKAVDLLLLS